MTNHWTDIPNADVILIMGANPAANHPASFGHIMDGLDQGTTLIVVDPRFTRSATLADIYAPLRPGTDIAFLGGMIRYVMADMEQNLDNYNLTYITEYTNAAFLLSPDYQGPAELEGMFSGFDPEKKTYDKTTWKFQLDENGVIKKDKTLQDPNSVFQTVKRHYERYTPERVNQITGTPTDLFLKICELMAATSRPDKAATIMYAMGWTQHTYGTQNIRAASILQLLLGNMGVAGGGINALRGESNVQGSTDYALLFETLPGYLRIPIATDTNLAAYLERTVPKTTEPQSANWWQNEPKYIVSLLKAWWGAAATQENDFAFHYLPKIPVGGNYSWLKMFHEMGAGNLKGMMVWGQNPAVCGPDSNFERSALDQLQWLVVVDLFETETATIWKRPGLNPADNQTEVFVLPAACSFEKEGSITNSSRLMQWRYKAVEPPGEGKPDLWILTHLMRRVQALYESEGGPQAEALTQLVWDYADEPDPQQVSREINGYALEDVLDKDGILVAASGHQIPGFANLTDDGKTACGNWIYCGHHIEKEGQVVNLAERRDLTDTSNIGLFPNFGWSWPANRRIIYNRASVDLHGQPWNRNAPVIWWDAENQKWLGDVPDGGAPPLAVDPEKGKLPFIMKADGVASLFGPGLADGPLPEHYEPWESPVENLISKTQTTPNLKAWGEPPKGEVDKYPVIATSYRLTEHWLSGGMTRNLPWLVETFPNMFVELSPDLAAERGIKQGDWVVVESARGTLKAQAVVTRRVQSFQINGKTIHQVAMPWHFGYAGLVTGDSANLLTPAVGDANTGIPEYKAFLCDIKLA
jgi:formate dehydrogenase major subunit